LLTCILLHVITVCFIQWGITVDASSADQAEEVSEQVKAVNRGGLSFEYDAAAAAVAPSAAAAPAAAAAKAASAGSEAPVPEADLSDLFAQLRSAQQ
jgi:hypothetical protein